MIDLVYIPSGEFLMGSPETEEGRDEDEGPQHKVIVPAFYMGKYPVTQAQWLFVAGLPQVKQKLQANPSRFNEKDCPVERVSWYDAVEFCNRLSIYFNKNYRLPTEAEWEYACRAGTTTPFYFGATITPDLVNYDGTYTYGNAPKGEYREQTTEVGNFPPNAFGLYDLHGNVWEWCLDHWHDSYRGAPTDGSAWLSENADTTRLLRGGSWFHYPVDGRSASRDSCDPGDRYDLLGFRVVCDV